ncbi:MAG: hypothetical protein Ct9H90mP16_19830 [Candidatus Poseidoniales archaeon]|nr:MAG: hypothetical protein Ct9H90mP16_19830 [Candidatus Poseidoniales archaeon]
MPVYQQNAMTMLNHIQFHERVNVKNKRLRDDIRFTFICTDLLFFIGNPTLEIFMQQQKLQQNNMVTFASLMASRRPRSPKDGALVHASGLETSGAWRPLVRTNAWQHVHRRSLEAKA